MDDELLAQLRKDLDKSGFGSEMRVLKTMVQRGWHYVGNEAYLDEDEGVYRDVDASGFIQRWCTAETGVVAAVFIFLAIEVKKAATPWVVFKPPRSSPYPLSESPHPLVYGSNLPCPLFRLQNAISAGSVAQSNGWFGGGIHEAFKSPSDKSRWYSAFVTSCKAAESIMNRETRAENPRGSISTDMRKKPAYLLVSRPVVVLDGVLVAAELDQHGELALENIDRAAFEFRFASKHCKENVYNVDVVTLTGFAEYLDSWAQRRNLIAEALHKFGGIETVSYDDD